MAFRLLALDLDGTVVSADLCVDPRDRDAIHRALDAGVRVVACTGRPFPGALPWARHLGLTDPIVCYQGAQVRDLGGAMLLDHGIEHALAMEVIELCRARGLHVQAYRDDRLLVERDRPEAQAYSRHAQMPITLVPDLDQAMGSTTPKLVVVADRGTVDSLLPEFRARWAGRLTVATSMPTYLEMTTAAADKRNALSFLCERFGIAQADTVAAGDGRNDQSMIEWAGLGAAVETAPDEVRAAAGRVIGAPGSGGIASLVDELLLR